MTMREGSGEEKLYLDVPFPDKEQVKALGARWDRDARSWYVPNHLDVESFTHWLALLPADDDPLLCIAGLPQCCWKCGEDTTTQRMVQWMHRVRCAPGRLPAVRGLRLLPKHWGHASDRRIGQNPARRALRRIQPRGLGHRQKLVVCYRTGIASCIQ